MTRTIGTHASKLKIPENWSHHDVFDNYLLHFAASDLLPGQIPLTPLLIISTEGVEEFEVEAIINFCMHRGKLQFLIQWVSYNRPIYQSFKDVKDAITALNIYFQRHSTAADHEIWANYDSNNHHSLYDDI